MVLGMAVLVVVMATAALYAAITAMRGLSRGAFALPFGMVNRGERPVTFWSVFAFHASVAVVFTYLIADAFL